jgi:TRAP-type C4-dicarboxylate transport system substrate-binding protein
MQTRRTGRAAFLAAVLALVLGAPAALAQQKYEMKVAYFVGDQHAMSQWVIRWTEQLEKGSGGRIAVKRFPSAQMGPAPQHYDFARTGQAEVAWFQHGGTPGRFPLTEIINLPFMAGSAEIGTKVLNDAELRAKYLDAEHRGVKVLVLFTHQPGGPHTTKKAIRTLEDFKGLRLRFPSPTVRDFVQALGATPVGVPPTEIGDQMSKGTLDGAFMDYGGVGIGFKLGGIIKYSTELYAYVTSFGLAMNEDFWAKLPPDLKKLVTESLTGREKEIGEGWDSLDVPGKKAIMDGGGEGIRLSPTENAKVRDIGAQVTEAKLKEYEAKGMPARAVYTRMRSLADTHAKSSKNFWN